MTQPAPIPSRYDRLITVIILAVTMAAALAIRILWPYDSVFVDGAVWFREMDSWYRMRLVDSFIHNFPLVTAFDPYSFFPNGIRSVFHPLTTWLIGVPALIFGGGKPSPQLIDTCGAYFPPLLGTLTVIPVYFIGRRLYGRIAGAMAAILIAIMPGEFLSRSLLGFTDHHVTEAFCSSLVLLFLMLAVREAENVGVILTRPADVLKPAYRRAIMLATFGGISLGLYLLSWRGGVFVLAVLVLYSIIRSLADYPAARSYDDVVLTFPIAGIIAFVMASPTIGPHYMPLLYVTAMVAVPAFPMLLKLLAHICRRRGWSRWAFAGTLAGGLVLALAALILISPALGRYIIGALDFMVPTGAHLTIMEMHPLFFPAGEFSTRVAWTNFTTTLALSIVAMTMLFTVARRPRGNHVTLLLTWSITMFAATMLQRRFGYYYAISAAVLCGFLCAWVFSHPYMRQQVVLLRQRSMMPLKTKSRSVIRALQAQKAERRWSAIRLALAGAIVVAVLILPNISMARNFAIEPGLMTKGWYETLLWLRDNTPEPLPPEEYYQLHDVPPNGTPYAYPASAYGVMAWWDFGHWITRLSHRIPEANPFQQGASTAGLFFTAQSETEGVALLQQHGCRYVIADFKTAILTFHGAAAWAGKDINDFYNIYMQRNDAGTWEPVLLFFPEYYRSMLVRLYNFNGEAYEPEQYTVIRSQVVRSRGQSANQIVDARHFETYDEVLAFLDQAEQGDWRLVSSNPLESAVPLQPLQQFTSEYESTAQSFLQAKLLPEVRVFRYDDLQP